MRTSNLTAMTPVCLPPEIFSPSPTPTKFMLGVGLVEAASAEKVVDCAGCKRRWAAARLAARRLSICVAEKPTKVMGALLARALALARPRLLVRFVAMKMLLYQLSEKTTAWRGGCFRQAVVEPAGAASR